MSPSALLCATILLGLAAGDAVADSPPGLPAHRPDAGSVGVVIPDTEPLPDGLRSFSVDAPCSVLIQIGAETLLAPERIDPLLEAAATAGLRVAVQLPDEAWEKATPVEVDSWAARIGAFARHAAGRVAAYQILERPAGDHGALDYAFLLKHGAVAIRAEDPRARIVSPALGLEDAAWVDQLYSQDAAPYLDDLAARDLASLRALADLRDRVDPSAALWLIGATVDPASPRPSALRTYVGARAASAGTVLFASPVPPGLGGFLAELRSLFPPALSPASAAALPFDPAAATVSLPGPVPVPVPGATQVEVIGFYDPRSRDGLAVYRAPGLPSDAAPGGSGAATIRFLLRSPVESVDLYDPETRSVVPIGSDISAGRVLFAPARSSDLLLRFRRAAAALPLQETQIGATTELSAEEIIALERQTHAAQQARLLHYEARASVAIHYRIAAVAQSVDVVSENRLFVHDGKQDYQQTDLFVDGARWRGAKPPYLPFIQPDKVKEVPLDITLDEGYRYSLVKRDRVDGRDCYVLAFEPKGTGLSLYQGRIYIDASKFTRVRMEAVQIGLKDPLRSNQVTYRFGPVSSPAGEFWLPQEVDGQMVFEVLGRNLVVERAARYSEFAINGDDFGERLAGAYQSGRPLFRETDTGYYKLDASGEEEVLTSASTPRNTFLVMGASVGSTGVPSLPFAGVNFFDFDYKGTGTQLNIAWAGPFFDLSWTNPHLTRPGPERTPLAITLQGTFLGVSQRDKIARDTGTSSDEYVDVYRESVQASLAVPMGHFLKGSLLAAATYMDFNRRGDTADAFVLPPTTIDSSLLARLEFNRSGYIASVWGESGRRSRWEPWGLPGNPYNPDDRTYTRLGADLKKSVYLGAFQKMNFGLSGFEGRGLDRFSRFELGDFRAARVRGFNGSGIHFDHGLVADTSYAFTIASALRVDTGVQAGWIRSLDDFGSGYQRVVGAGMALEFSGPWSTLVNVRFGRALSSTIGDRGGGGDVRVVLFKTFDRWGRKPKR